MIVWEEKWHDYPDMPHVGEYIQMQIEHDDTKNSDIIEGIVSGVSEQGVITIVPDEYGDRWYWVQWRRGALPEHRSVERREKVDA